ncbi:hypothetical protein Tco_0046005 [Tanacetum coccineum]
MSSASSAVTSTFVYTDSKPSRAFWGADDEEIFEGEPIYPEYIPLEDEHEFTAKEQPLPYVDSPTAESPGYVTESDPEEDPKEYEDDETEDGPVDYPMDGGDDGDDDDGDSSRDDANDEVVDDDVEVHGPTYNSSPLLPSSGCPTQIQTLRIASTQALIDAVIADFHYLHYLQTLLYAHIVDHREREYRVYELPPRKRLCLSNLGSDYEVGRRGEVNTRVTELAELHEHDTQDLYALLEDAQDRVTLQETIWMVEEEAYALREALGLLDRFESGDTHLELQDPRDHLYALENPFRHTRPAPAAGYSHSDTVSGQIMAPKDHKRDQIPNKQPPNPNNMTSRIHTSIDLTKLLRNLNQWRWDAIVRTRITKVKGNDVPAYTERFQELTLICTKFVANETEKVDKYISGLPDNIYGNVKSARPKTLDETIELANDLMD